MCGSLRSQQPDRAGSLARMPRVGGRGFLGIPWRESPCIKVRGFTSIKAEGKLSERSAAKGSSLWGAREGSAPGLRPELSHCLAA